MPRNTSYIGDWYLIDLNVLNIFNIGLHNLTPYYTLRKRKNIVKFSATRWIVIEVWLLIDY